MRFLFKVAFWLTIVVLLLPAENAERSADGRVQVGPVEAFGAAQAAVEDARGFCERRPDACTTGSQAFQTFGEKAHHGVKLLYEFLASRFPEPPNTAPRTTSVPLESTGSIVPRSEPGRHTLTPADLEPAWSGPELQHTRPAAIPLPPRRPA